MVSTVIPFAKKMRLVEDLMYYDGPLISHYASQGPQQFIVLWAGCPDEHTCMWYVMEITTSNLKLFLTDKLTLRAVMEQSPGIFHCKNHFIDEQEVAHGKPIKFEDISDDELPSPNAFLHASMP